MPQADSRNKLTLRQQSIYLLPNLFTLAALFAGFFAVVQAMNQRFETAAVAVFIAMVLDGMDGRVARMTRTQSDFGMELDSLADLVSFGVAPAALAFTLGMRGGWDAVVLVYFVLGYSFYAAMYAAVGAMVSSDQEAQQVQTPVAMLLVVPVLCVQLVASAPRSGAARMLTLVPFSSPVLMPMRWLLGGASVGELLLSLAILIASTVVVARIAAKVYRVGILMYGKRPSLRELWRWMRY